MLHAHDILELWVWHVLLRALPEVSIPISDLIRVT